MITQMSNSWYLFDEHDVPRIIDALLVSGYTRPWEVFHEGPTAQREGSFTDTQRYPFTDQDFRFTVGGNALDAIFLGWPEHEVCMGALGSASSVSAAQIVGVTMLGVDNELSWWQDTQGLHLQPPPTRPYEHAYTFTILLHAA